MLEQSQEDFLHVIFDVLPTHGPSDLRPNECLVLPTDCDVRLLVAAPSGADEGGIICRGIRCIGNLPRARRRGLDHRDGIAVGDLRPSRRKRREQSSLRLGLPVELGELQTLEAWEWKNRLDVTSGE
jgi:hypothetical protein